MSSNESSSREYALDVELGEHYYRGDGELEEQLIEETIAIIKEYIDRRFDQGRRPALRAAHAEATGRVCATFQVDDDLRERAPDLMRGVFATPGRTYQAWIRFSNGNSELQNHHLPDPRGMAIKLLEVVGDRLLQDERHTQDFILVNRPVFFGDDLERYLSGSHFALHTPIDQLGNIVGYDTAGRVGRLVGGSVRYSERHIRGSRKSKYFRGRGRQIDYASPHERPSIIYPYQRLAAISVVFHSNHCTERETSMSRSQGVLIQLFTACSLFSRRPVIDRCDARN
jgi:hypothetical protein